MPSYKDCKELGAREAKGPGSCADVGRGITPWVEAPQRIVSSILDRRRRLRFGDVAEAYTTAEATGSLGDLLLRLLRD